MFQYRLNVASVHGNIGPVGIEVGLGFDTGARIGQNGVELQILGTGFLVDKDKGIEFSFLGNNIGIPKFWWLFSKLYCILLYIQF